MLCTEEKLSEKELSVSELPKQFKFKLAIVGGSNSVMRDGYTQYLKEYIDQTSHYNLELSYFSLGGVTNLFGAIQNCRYEIAKYHNVILFEYCVNDRSAFANGKYTPKIAGMVLEGFIRQVKSVNPNCIIIIAIFGTNSPDFYNNCCCISSVYESVARRYEVPVINVTEILLKKEGIKFIKQLYKQGDRVHFSRPKGAKVAGKIIAKQIINRKLFDTFPKQSELFYRMYAENIQDLKFFSNFDYLAERTTIKKRIFKNSLFEEEFYSIDCHTSISLKLRGKLLGIMIKSDVQSGLIEIKLGKQKLITSSLAKGIPHKTKKNINLLSLPYQKFDECNDFDNLSISVCKEKIDKYELDIYKVEPVVPPDQWKLNIIGIAYTGEISTGVGKGGSHIKNCVDLSLLNTGSYEAYYFKGLKHMDKSQYTQAENSFKQAIKMNPQNAAHYCDLGELYQQQQQLDKAELLYKKAIEIEPDSVDFYKLLGKILVDKENYTGAALTYKQAIKLAPRDEELYSLLGDVLVNLKRFDLAEKCYLHALKLNPQKVYYHRRLGDIFKQQEKMDLAISHYEQALAIAPKNPWLYIHLSEALIEQNKLEEANKKCKQSLKFIQPKRIGFYRRVGDIQVKIGSFDDAIDTYKQAIKLNPNHRNKKVLKQIRSQIDRATSAKECSQVG